MATLYVTVLTWASGWGHVGDQLRASGPLVPVLWVVFGVQVALIADLRRRAHPTGGATAVDAAGAGATTVGMLACCAHHAVELLPLAGLAGAAGVVAGAQQQLLYLALAVSLAGLVWTAHRWSRAGHAVPSEAFTVPTERKDAMLACDR